MDFYTGLNSWIYILFGILWIAFAIFKGSRHETAEKSNVNTSTSATSGIEDIMGTILSEKDIIEDVSEIPKEKVPEKSNNFEEGVPTTTEVQMPIEKPTPPTPRRINIKKAIIYSEILRRPYE